MTIRWVLTTQYIVIIYCLYFRGSHRMDSANTIIGFMWRVIHGNLPEAYRDVFDARHPDYDSYIHWFMFDLPYDIFERVEFSDDNARRACCPLCGEAPAGVSGGYAVVEGYTADGMLRHLRGSHRSTKCEVMRACQMNIYASHGVSPEQAMLRLYD